MTLFRPMLLSRATAVPRDDASLVLEPKADGVRAILRTDSKGRARLFTRHGTDITELLDNLDCRLTVLPPTTTLDGELVALERRPDGEVGYEFQTVMTQLLTRHRPRSQPERALLHLLLFDCVQYRDADLDARPWEARREILEDLAASAELDIVPLFDSSPEVFESLVSKGMEGVVIKRRSGRYHRGRRSSAWRKFKARGELTVRVLGADGDRTSGVVEHVAVVEPGGDTVSVAQVWSGEHRAALAASRSGHEQLTARIAYTYRSPKGRLREARLLSLDRA